MSKNRNEKYEMGKNEEREQHVTVENRPHCRSLLDHDANHFPVLDKFVSFRLVIAFVLQQRHCSLASHQALSRFFSFFFFFQPDANNEIILRSKKNHPYYPYPLVKKSNRTRNHFAPQGSNVIERGGGLVTAIGSIDRSKILNVWKKETQPF